MNLRRRCGLVSRGNQGHAVFSRFRVAPHRVSRGWCVERRRQRRRYNPRDEREQFVPLMWRGFEPGPQSISSPFADLPIAVRRAVLMLQARRFRCEAVLCERRIFTERFNDNILKPWARRTARLDQIVQCLALVLGGRPGPSFARRLSIPVSNDTLLRAVRRRGAPSFAPPVIIGIDDGPGVATIAMER